jgi:opacity protein-like surface antigen
VKRPFLAPAFAILVSCGSSLAAQTVGSVPDQSPYLDLRDGMRFGLVAGWLAAGSDPVGVGPKSAPMLGVRYDLAVGGPVYLTGSLFGLSTTRRVLDYTRTAATRDIGTQSTALVNANVAVAMSLTGLRTWHHLQPLINLGVGVVAAPGDKVDVSGMKLGTMLSFSYGFGVRYATGRNSELRFDLNQYWWQLKYPDLYRSTQGDPVAIRPTGGLSAYTANTALTVAWSLRSFR